MSTEALSSKKTQASVMDKIARRARENMADGAVTDSYTADPEEVIRILNEALATELVCVLRYRSHHFAAEGLRARPLAKEFLEHARQEMAHADRIAGRIVQLGGRPDFDPDRLKERSHADFSVGSDLEGMIRENLVAERLAVQTYTEIIRILGNEDPTTRRMIEEILAQEEEHADELAGFLKDFED